MKTTNKPNILYFGMLFMLGSVLLLAESASELREKCKNTKNACRVDCNDRYYWFQFHARPACHAACDDDYIVCLAGRGRYKSNYFRKTLEAEYKRQLINEWKW
jgi:hypothetical protein